MNNVSRAMMARIAELEHLDMLRRPLRDSELKQWQELIFLLESQDPLTHDKAEMLLNLYMAVVPPALRW